jgi:hypothetical protein
MDNNMKKLKLNHTKKLRNFVSVLVIAGIGLTTVGTLVHAATTGAQVYIAPSTGTYTVGSDVALQIRENGNGTAINGVQLGIKYLPSYLQFKSIDSTSGAFTTNLSPPTQNSGEVTLTYADLTGSFTTDELIATVHFTALAAGSDPLTFTNTCQSESTPASDCSDLSSAGSSTSTTLTGGTYTIQAATTTPPPTTTTPPPSTTTTTPPPAPASTSSSATSTASAATSTAKSNSTSITPAASNAPITVPNGAQVQVSTPATIQPTTIQSDGVKKVQYYLNKKLVYTSTAAPYAYNLNTPDLRNGKYTLTKETYYTSGKTSLDSYNVAVKNPFSFKQFLLDCQQYAWLIIVICVLLIILISYWMLRSHYPPGNGPLRSLKNKVNNPGSTAPPTNLVSPMALAGATAGAGTSHVPGSLVTPGGNLQAPLSLTATPQPAPTTPAPSAQVVTPTEIPVTAAPQTEPLDLSKNE